MPNTDTTDPGTFIPRDRPSPLVLSFVGRFIIVQLFVLLAFGVFYLALLRDVLQDPLILILVVTTLLVLSGLATVYVMTVRLADQINYLRQRVVGQLTESHHDRGIYPIKTTGRNVLTELEYWLTQLQKDHSLTIRRLSRRADRNRMLNLIAATINRTFDLQEVFDLTLNEALRNINWDVGALYMWDKRVGALNMVSYIGLPEDTVRELYELSPQDSSIGTAARTHQIVIVTDALASSTHRDHVVSRIARTHICAPLVAVTHELLGVLFVGHAEQIEPEEDDINLLATVANQVALAMEKAELYITVSRHAEDLEDLVEERTRELEEAVDELSVALTRAKEADKVKSLLLSTVSHELRTPLATIKGNTSLLQEHHRQLDSAAVDDHLRDIEEETDKLTELISNLMEMSRIEGGTLHIQREPIDISEVLQNSVDAAQIRLNSSQANPHQIDLRCQDRLPMVLGDARRIEQILANLLDNAAKYSKPGEAISVATESRGHELIVSVEDRGKGIPKEHIDLIFERFYQVVERGDAHRQGIGLGLAICKGLVEAHEGRIWVESVIGVGSTFFFSLPYAVPIKTEEGKRHEPDTHPRN